MSITGEFDGLILAAAIVSERILLSSASACKLNLHATGSTARVRAFSGASGGDSDGSSSHPELKATQRHTKHNVGHNFLCLLCFFVACFKMTCANRVFRSIFSSCLTAFLSLLPTSPRSRRV